MSKDQLVRAVNEYVFTKETFVVFVFCTVADVFNKEDPCASIPKSTLRYMVALGMGSPVKISRSNTVIEKFSPQVTVSGKSISVNAD